MANGKLYWPERWGHMQDAQQAGNTQERTGREERREARARRAQPQDCIAHKEPLEQPSKKAEHEKISIRSSRSHCMEMQMPKAQSPSLETSAKFARKITGRWEANFHQATGLPVSEKVFESRALAASFTVLALALREMQVTSLRLALLPIYIYVTTCIYIYIYT